MKLIKTGACLVAALIVGLVGAASASALPEVGRCVKVKKGTGQYLGGTCNRVSPGKKGDHNFLAPVQKKWEAVGGLSTLETKKMKIQCGASKIVGEWTGTKTAVMKPDLVGCLNLATKKSCQAFPPPPPPENNNGELDAQENLESALGFIKGGARPLVGIDAKKAGKPLITFTCGSPPQEELIAELNGSVIGALAPLNKVTTEFSLTYKVSKGAQVPEKFEGGPKDTLTLTVKPIPGTETTEPAVLSTGTDELSNEESLEIKAR